MKRLTDQRLPTEDPARFDADTATAMRNHLIDHVESRGDKIAAAELSRKAMTYALLPAISTVTGNPLTTPCQLSSRWILAAHRSCG
jgi:hypothetical protein